MKIIGNEYADFIPLHLKGFNKEYHRVIITHLNDMYTKTFLEKEGINNMFESLYKLKNNMGAKLYSYNVLTNKSTELNKLHEDMNMFLDNTNAEFGLFDSASLHALLSTFKEEKVLIINLSNFHIGFVEQGIDLQNFLMTSKNENLDILHYVNAGSVYGPTNFMTFDTFKPYNFLKNLNLSYIDNPEFEKEEIKDADSDDYLMSILERFSLNIKRNKADKKFLESIIDKEFVNKLFVNKLSSIVQNKFNALVKNAYSTCDFILGISNSDIKFNMTNYDHLLKVYKAMTYAINKLEFDTMMTIINNGDKSESIITAYAMTSLNTILGYDFSPVYSNTLMSIKTLPEPTAKYFDNYGIKTNTIHKIKAGPSIVMIPIIQKKSLYLKDSNLTKLLLGYSFGKSGLNFRDKMHFAYQSTLIKYISDSLVRDFKGPITPILMSIGYLKYNFKRNDEIIEFIDSKKSRSKYDYNDLVSMMISYIYSDLNFNQKREFQFVEAIISELFRKVLSRSLENFNSFDVLNLSKREIVAFLNEQEVSLILENILAIASLPIILKVFHKHIGQMKDELLDQMSEYFQASTSFGNLKGEKIKVVNEIVQSANLNLTKFKCNKTRKNISLFNKLYAFYGFDDKKGEIFMIKNLLNGIIFKKNKIYNRYFNDAMLIPKDSIKQELREKDKYIRKFYVPKIKI